MGYESHLTEVEAAVARACAHAVGEITAALEAQMKLHCDQVVYQQPPAPSGYKRTGNLLGSIQSEVDGTVGLVEATADYAAAVHEGTAHTVARPFGTEALKDEQKHAAGRLADALRRELT